MDATWKNGTRKGENDLRPYYSEFVRHCLRYYIKTIDEGKGGCPQFRSDADRDNWKACHYALKHYSDADMDVICHLYRSGDTIADKIYFMAKTTGKSQDYYWNIVTSVERKIAKMRGLL